MPPQIQQWPQKGLLDRVRGMTRWPPLPDEKGETRWGFRLRMVILRLLLLCSSSSSFFFFFFFFFLVLVPEIFFNLHCSLLMIFFVSPNGFANKNATIPNFGLMNQASLDKILKAEVFIHTDSHLKVAHLILDYFPISKSFQAPKCVIKARDPRL